MKIMDKWSLKYTVYTHSVCMYIYIYTINKGCIHLGIIVVSLFSFYGFTYKQTVVV